MNYAFVQRTYLIICGVACGIVAGICAYCYILLFYRIRTQSYYKKEGAAQQQHKAAETKMIWVGVVLFVLQCFCAVFCISIPGPSFIKFS